MARSETASDQLVQRLIDWGIDTVFGLPGDGINGVMESLRTHADRIRFVHVRHEETAALAACAYGKFTGRPAACLSTAAPGAVHLMNGLYDARIDQSPVVAITGMTYHDVIGTHYLQDINHDFVLNDPCVYSQRIMGEAHVIPAVDMAVRSAIGHRGPAALAMPIDIQSGDAVTGDRSIKNIEGHSAAAALDGRRLPPRERIEHAARALSSASRPLIFIGAGARGAGDEVERVAEKLGAPIVKAMLGKDAVPDDSPYCLGGYAMVGTRPAQNALMGCDAILIVGSSSPYIEFLPAPGSAAAERCFGVGACRDQNAVMCPSYQVTGEEQHSTRGRALILTDGFRCRSQIEHATDRSALHLAQVVQMAMRDGPNGPVTPRPERRYQGAAALASR